MIDSSLSILTSSPRNSNQKPHPSILWIVISLVSLVVFLELVSSIDAVFSYLYIGPILLASRQFNRRFTIGLTLLAAFFTIVNLWIPGGHTITATTVENRLITVLALVVTEILSHRNRYFEDSIAKQKAKLQMQEELASIREDFVSTLTHDLKTPLLGAIEMLKALQQEHFGHITTEQHKVLNTMAHSHQSSLQLLETLLDVYRNDAEGVRLERSPINLVALTRQVVDTLNGLATNYQVLLNFNCRGLNTDDVLVNGDALQLRRVISNLLINAINHSPIDGQVEIVVESRGDRPHLQQIVQIMDEGPGIYPEELPQLFERFYRGHSDRQAKGAGLGLYLSRQIVEAHGGTIWAENRLPRGAIFGFCLAAHPTYPLV